MKNSAFAFFAAMVFIGCQSENPLIESMNCSKSSYDNTIEVQDFNQNFTLQIPTHWKINHYYDQYKSEIFAADTLKPLTETYIFDASYNNGTVVFNDYFFKRNDSVFKREQLEVLRGGSIALQEKTGYWHLLKGEKNGYTYHKFNLVLIVDADHYFNTFTELYGESDIEQRICDAISLLDALKFSK